MKDKQQVKWALIAASIIMLTILMAAYFAQPINNPPANAFELREEDFKVHRYCVFTGHYAGLNVIRIQYVGSQQLPANLTIQAEYKDTGKILREKAPLAYYQNQTEIGLFEPPYTDVVVTIEYNAQTIKFTK